MGPGYTPEDLRRMLSAVCLEETEALSISVTHEDPQTAMEMVNAILDTAPAEILRIVHTGGNGNYRPGRLAGATGCPLRLAKRRFGGVSRRSCGVSGFGMGRLW